MRDPGDLTVKVHGPGVGSFIFTRIELCASDMLLLQYSVTEGQKKGELDYTDVNEVLMIVLMVESPKHLRILTGKATGTSTASCIWGQTPRRETKEGEPHVEVSLL